MRKKSGTKKKNMLIVTCEHGGNQVPQEYQNLFRGHEIVLCSHRGMDFGALELTQALKKRYRVPAITSQYTRLLVELNRSINHPDLFSEVVSYLPEDEKQAILKKYYYPYRKKVEAIISKNVSSKHRVLHLSIHSFTPIWEGMMRSCDIGFLYDPQRDGEREFCKNWKENIRKIDPDLRLRYNYPYRGVSDGLTTYLRKKFSSQEYIGIELEVNQHLLTSERKKEVIQIIVDSLSEF